MKPIEINGELYCPVCNHPLEYDGELFCENCGYHYDPETDEEVD